jgi:hypothetical protein
MKKISENNTFCLFKIQSDVMHNLAESDWIILSRNPEYMLSCRCEPIFLSHSNQL